MKVKLINFLCILLYVIPVNTSHRSHYDVERWKPTYPDASGYTLENYISECQRRSAEQEPSYLAYSQQQQMFDYRSQVSTAPPIDVQSLTKSYYANYIMHTDAHISAIKAEIDRQLSNIEVTLNFGSTYERYQILELLDQLATSFDSYHHALERQYQNSNYDPVVARNLYGVQCLRNELHDLTNCIKVQLFSPKGEFLDKNPDAIFRNRLKGFFTHHKNVGDLIEFYDKQYENGRVEDVPSIDSKRLELIQNHPFNKALEQVNRNLKQGNLDQADRICQQFASNKNRFQILQNLKASSKALNQYGMPKVWESHPNWAAYKQELIAHPGKRDVIIQALQHDHNKAYELCNRASIKVPTAAQLNYAHQLGQYHKDPSFMDIASRGLQDKASFEKAIRMFDQRAYVLAQIQDIALRYPDNIPLLQQRMDKLVLCSHDPEFLSILNEMASDLGKIDVLCKDLLGRDLYVHELRKQLGYPFFTEHVEQLAYQLAGAKSDAERIELLHNVCTNYNDDAYLAFHDTKTHLPKLFNYDQQLLKTELPACFGTQEFAQERKLYTQVMMQPLTCHEQFLQAQQCVSLFNNACAPQENQTVYRDLARTAAQTYLNQSYNITPVDRMQQVELFDRACRAIERGDITQADIPVQLPQVIEKAYEHYAHVDYKQLHENVLEKCVTHQNGAFADYYQSREHALKQIVDGNGALYKQTYELSPQAERILEKNGFDLTQFTTCTGNLLQQDTHAKFVQTLNTLAQKPVLTGATQQIKEGVLECAQAGSQFNQNGNVKEAMILSDFCHVAVEYFWQGIDASIAVSKGVAEGVYVGVSSEIVNTFRDPHALQETFLTEGSWTEPDLRDRVVMETATIVADLVRLVKDSGEVAFSGVAGVGDAIVSLPELVSNCIEVTKVTGQCLGYVAEEIVWLLDAAERKDVVAFQRQSEKMQQECALVAQSIGEYLSQLKECKHNYNGQITKEDLKEFARFGGRFVAEGVILSNALRGCTKILKGAAQYAKSTESALVQLQHMKDVSKAQVRNVILSAQLNLASPTFKTPGMRAAVEQVVTRGALASEAEALPSFVKVGQGIIEKSIIQQGETSSSSSLAQKVGQYLSLEPKPGYILIPGMDKDKLSNVDRGAQLWQQLHDAKSVKERREIFLQVEDIRLLDERVEQLYSVVSDKRPGEFYEKVSASRIPEFEEKLPKMWDQIRMRTDDVSRISQNINIPEQIVQKIKEHVFIEEHLLDRGIGRFDPDADMFQAWMRLINGDYVQSDLRLLQHELAESHLMQGKVLDYRSVHDIINQVYNWEDFLK